MIYNNWNEYNKDRPNVMVRYHRFEIDNHGRMHERLCRYRFTKSADYHDVIHFMSHHIDHDDNRIDTIIFRTSLILDDKVKEILKKLNKINTLYETTRGQNNVL